MPFQQNLCMCMCGSVAEWFGCWTCNQHVAGQIPAARFQVQPLASCLYTCASVT